MEGHEKLARTHDTTAQIALHLIIKSSTRQPVTRTIYAALLCFALMGASCKSKSKSKDEDNDPVAPSEVQPALVEAPIPEHFAYLTTAKDLLLFSDTKGFHESVHRITNGSESSPIAWKPFQNVLQRIAIETKGSEDISELSTSVASFARTCGDCHRKLGAAVVIEIRKPRQDSPNFDAHMANHLWALDSLWAGLATPSNEHWVAGAKLLSDTPTHLRNLAAYGDDTERAIELAETVHGFAAKASATQPLAARASMFGTILSACATCHALPGSTQGD